jgi:hypothetical protein
MSNQLTQSQLTYTIQSTISKSEAYELLVSRFPDVEWEIVLVSTNTLTEFHTLEIILTNVPRSLAELMLEQF